MRRSDFRDGYLDQRAYLQRDPHPLRGDLLQKSAKWSETFAVHLDQVLSGEHLSDEAASTTLGGYSYWLRNDFARNMTRMDELFSDDPDIDIHWTSSLEWDFMHSMPVCLKCGKLR